MIFVKVNGTEHPAEVSGMTADRSWDNRESKTIKIEASYDEIKRLMPDDVHWSIVMREVDESGAVAEEEWDNSDYSISGDITDHRDGTASIKMGKPTDLEEAYEMIYGGDM